MPSEQTGSTLPCRPRSRYRENNRRGRAACTARRPSHHRGLREERQTWDRSSWCPQTKHPAGEPQPQIAVLEPPATSRTDVETCPTRAVTVATTPKRTVVRRTDQTAHNDLRTSRKLQETPHDHRAWPKRSIAPAYIGLLFQEPPRQAANDGLWSGPITSPSVRAAPLQ